MELQLRPRFALLLGALFVVTSGCDTGTTPPLIPEDARIVAPDGSIPRQDAGSEQTCEVGMIACGGGVCANVVSDSQNCGSCGNVCPSGVTCALGRCDCEAPMLGCDGLCADPSTDVMNCGSCGNACGAAESCQDGSCVVECDEPAVRCANHEVEGPRFVCATTDSDPMNCGGCGTRCAGGAICEEGRCACPAGQVNCSGVCTDPSTDANNCGACLNSCGADGVCTAGACSSCGTGLSACGTPARCTDTDTSRLHCGACGNTCGPGESCTDGACDCLPGFDNCGSTCVNFSGDPRNCGGCGVDCGPAGMCSDGVCVCAAGTMECGAECADLDTSASHCGACDASCATGERCFAGVCRLFNDTCATATPVTGDTVITGQNSEDGGPRPMGDGCGTGTNNKALYYAVTIPPGDQVVVEASFASGDLVLFAQEACGDTSCTQLADTIGSPERFTISNVGSSSALTRIVGVRGWGTGTLAGGIYDIAFTYSTPVVADNAICTTATEITSTTTIMGANTEEGGPRPSSSCGSGSGNKALYYSVTIPAGVEVDVLASFSGSVDLVLFELAACADTACARFVDTTSTTERITLSNAEGTTDVTRILGVRSWDSDDPGGPFNIEFTYHEPAANAVCPGARPVTATTTFTGENTRNGGPRATGANCGTGGTKALYYSVTIPAGEAVEVTTTSTGGSVVVFEQAACSDTDCAASASSTLTLLNPGSSAVTRIVGIRASTTGTSPVYEATFTYSTPTFAANASCDAATPVTADATITGQDTGLGGPRPGIGGTSCGSGTGFKALYYAVSIPAGQAVAVNATPMGGTIVLFEQAACGNTTCTGSASSSTAATLNLLNPEAMAVTRIVGVRASLEATSPAPTYDIQFTYSTPTFAPNASCTNATPVTADTMFSGEDTGAGGPRPGGANCGTSAGARALYYAVTIPVGQVVSVTTTTTGNILLFEQAACGETNCITSTDTAPERLALSNLEGTTEVTRIIGVRASGTPTAPPTFGIAFTYVENASCETATLITGTRTIMGENTENGGPRPTGIDCRAGSSTRALYYAVTVPAGGGPVTVRATPATTVDLVLFEQAMCGDTDCTGSVDGNNTGGVETLTLTNTGTSDVIRILGVRGFNTPGSGVSFPGGAFDITFTYPTTP